MFVSEKTKYWQEEYKNGNLANTDMCGETRALLDGSAEKEFWIVLKYLTVFYIGLFITLSIFCGG